VTGDCFDFDQKVFGFLKKLSLIFKNNESGRGNPICESHGI
jgi:hypothetical protein